MAEVKKLANENMAYGGDMIADAFGNLYVISAAGNVFKLNPNSMDASFVGKIKNLPEKYIQRQSLGLQVKHHIK